jgi:3-isopropylmalate/(R)-2-methylmalate dehydratase small subunit
MRLRGKVWKFGDDIDTDQIYPGKYLPLTDKEEMAEHAMEGIPDYENFSKMIKKGDIIVGGKNFGCGSSREHAPISIEYAGIDLIIAKSFARIFYRNCVNIGFPILEAEEEDIDNIDDSDELEIDLEKGEIRNLTKMKTFKGKALSGLEMEIMNAGGLLDYLKGSSKY